MSVLELLMDQVDGSTVSQISNTLGLDERQTATAVSSAMPLLLQALANNAQNEGGAAALASALEKDHDGSILENIGSYAGSPDIGAGESILKHVLGGQRSTVESGLASLAGGLDKQDSAKILAILAPIVMGAISRRAQSGGGGLDAGSLMDMLAGEREEVQRREPEATSVLESLLDSNNDGNVSDDLVNIGSKLLGSFLK